MSSISSSGYGQLPSDLRADEDIGTRLGEPTVTIRLARRENGDLVPWFRAGGAARFDWALSELRVRKALWRDAKAPPEDAPLLERAMKDWTEWERSIVLVEVGVDGRIRLQNGDFSLLSNCWATPDSLPGRWVRWGGRVPLMSTRHRPRAFRRAT